MKSTFTYQVPAIIPFCLCVSLSLMSGSCKKEEINYNPCLKRFPLETLRPSQHSLDWIPYTNKQEIIFTSGKDKIIKLVRASDNEQHESLKSQIEIPCPYDSSQSAYMDYTTKEYRNRFIVEQGITSLISIDIIVDVILDEKNSNLVDVSMADILKVDLRLKQSGQIETTHRILQFPILDRGFNNALASSYIFDAYILLNNESFPEVFSNYENNEQIRVYYSAQGLLGFEIEGALYLRLN